MRRFTLSILMIFAFLATIAQGCSDDNKEVDITLGRKKYVKRYDTATLAAVISPNAYYAVIATKAKFPALWGLEQQEEMYKFEAAYTINAKLFSFNEDARFVAIASGKFVTLWNVETGKKLEEFEVPYPITSLSLNRNARYTVVGTDAGVAFFIITANGRIVRQFNHGAAIVHTDITPDGEFVVTSAKNNVVKIWQVTNAKRLFNLLLEKSPNLILMDSHYVFTAQPQGDMNLWSAVSGDKLFTLNNVKSTTTAASMAKTEKLLVTANMPNEINVWNMRDGRLVASTKLKGLTSWTQGQRYVLSIAFGEKPGEIHIEDSNGVGEIVYLPKLASELEHIRGALKLEAEKEKQSAIPNSANKKDIELNDRALKLKRVIKFE